MQSPEPGARVKKKVQLINLNKLLYEIKSV